MFMIGPIGFTVPWLLLGLLVLPLLWILLRAVPPAPIRRRFPGVALLLGLKDDESQADKTPWWLLLLRMIALAAVIIGFAGPVLNPKSEHAGTGNLLILLDASWADAANWQARQDRLNSLLEEAARAGRPTAVVALTDLNTGALPFQAADVWQSRIAGLLPAAWGPQDPGEWAENLAQEESFETYWLSDGLKRPMRANLLKALESKGTVTVFESPRAIYGLKPARFADGEIRLMATRARADSTAELTVSALGLDPAGVDRALARTSLQFPVGQTEAEAVFTLPSELRNRITRFAIAGIRSAGAVSLTDDALRRREIALISARAEREGLQLLAPLHYLRKALEPTADILDGALDDILPANPDVIVLADVAKLTESEKASLTEWVKNGGLLLRFAGPQLAASDLSRNREDELMPVRLRAGGRTVGGAMSWGAPKKLRPFSPESPFFGLTIPDDVEVTAQVLAQPDPTLSSRVIAALADGTPLVTRKKLGQGQVVLFHVTANAQWSTLPLSGLFVDMLERLAVSTRPAAPDAQELAGTRWTPEKQLNGFGELGDSGMLADVTGERIATGEAGPDLPPGIYSGEDRSLAVNVLNAKTKLAPTAWPARIQVEGLKALRETGLKGAFLAAALLALMLDILAALWVAGKLRGPKSGVVAGILVSLLVFPSPGHSQDMTDAEAFAIEAAAQVTLAHVLTGDAQVDRVAQAGLVGLSDVLFRRSSIEPGLPIGVDIEKDDLSLFPMLYWPVTVAQPHPSDIAYAKLNEYLRKGGMILFDTRDGNVAGYGQSTPEARKLQALALPLDIPPLEPIPEDHVLTRTFYLLQTFPGRYERPIWVEAAPADAVKVEGMPFRNLNDGVSPVIIGGNDWAAAWAVDARGAPMFPVGRGYTGERQREIAYRFGLNLMMYVLTGNYKSDQVHVPALLERLGQ